MKLKDFLECVSPTQDVRIEYIKDQEMVYLVHSAIMVKYCHPELKNKKVITSHVFNGMLSIFVASFDLDD